MGAEFLIQSPLVIMRMKKLLIVLLYMLLSLIMNCFQNYIYMPNWGLQTS
nr:MAG TPA: Ail/Lom protein [Caudoviricetes sp.]